MELVRTYSVIGSNMRPFQRLRTRCVIGAYVYGAGTSLEGKNGKLQGMCTLFRVNCVLRIENRANGRKIEIYQRKSIFELKC